ncbi:MAG: ATP-binding protein [Terriglobales bacterium]
MSFMQSVVAAGMRRERHRPQDWLVGGGKMGELIRSMDWTSTPLGPIASWPQSLRTTVSLCLGSNFPISLAWGPRHVQIYNDGYWPLCGEKHPHAMGQDFSVCWASAWPVVGDAFARALGGETSYLENQRMFLDRKGYLEETFFTFSFSPIRDETGVAGLFHPVTETTSRMLAERRTRLLRDLANRTGKAQSVEDACTQAAKSLSEYARDLPFVLFYLIDDRGNEARLIASTGLPPGGAASPEVVRLGLSEESTWPLGEMLRSGAPQHITGLAVRSGPLSCGEYPESPKEALLLPITPPGCKRPIAVVVAGVSSRLPLDETYRAFYDLLAAAVTTEITNARAYAEERNRAGALAAMMKELEHSNQELEAFSYSVSHDLRAPLRVIDGFSKALLDDYSGKLDDQGCHYLERVRTAAQKMSALINDLLDLSRVSRGALRKELVNLSTIAHCIIGSRQAKSPLRHVAVEISGGLRAIADKRLITLVLVNLLDNAWKYTANAPHAQVAFGRSNAGPEPVFYVRDNGVGFDMAYRDKLFAPFQRLHRESEFEGTGIGLATVQRVISRHGGRIWAEAAIGKGATFYFTLGDTR